MPLPLSSPLLSSSFSTAAPSSRSRLDDCLRSSLSSSSSSIAEEEASAAANFFRVRANDRDCRDVKVISSGVDFVLVLYFVMMLESLEVRIVHSLLFCEGVSCNNPEGNYLRIYTLSIIPNR